MCIKNVNNVINDVNGVVLVSLLLTVNIFQTLFLLLLWTGKRLLGLYWKCYHFWRQNRVYYALYCSILSVNKIYKRIAFELITSKPYRWISKKFLQRSLFQTLILAKKIGFTFNITYCMYIYLFTDFAL